MARTRHRSTAVQSYKRPSDELLKKVTNVLQTPKSPIASGVEVESNEVVAEKRVSVKAGTPPGTPGTHPEPHPEHPEPYPEHPEPHPEHPEPYPEHQEPRPEHPEPHPEHAGIRAMQQRTCFSINSRVSH